MARFYGTIRGNRGETSRLGHESGGLTTRAASWSGAVETHLYVNEGTDYARVELTRHNGAGTNKLIYEGPVAGWGK